MTGKLGFFYDAEFQNLIDSFAYCFKVNIAVYDSKMEKIISGLQKPNSRFCQLIQEKLLLCNRCCRQDKLMCERCKKENSYLTYNCFAGPSEAVYPIRIEGTTIGYGMVGQFRTSRRLSNEMLFLWKKADYEQKTLIEAFNELPLIDRAMIENLSKLFTALITFAINQEYLRTRCPDLAEKVSRWLDEHIAEPIALDDIATELGSSKSNISHTIKKKLGVSFKQLLILKRIERFERIIVSDPKTTIQEASANVSYENPLYFSRIYKKVRNVPPSTYITSLRKHDLVFSHEQ